MANSVFIVSAARTPIGSYLGALSAVPAPRLGAAAIQGALDRAHATSDQVDEVFMGNVLSAGIGQAPARQASLFAGVPESVPCTTVSKVCGSGMQAAILGARAVALGDAEAVLVGGMESMSRVPYYLDKARTGYRMGNGSLIDGMIHDGLWDPYKDFHMGNAGELCVEKYGFTREGQDEFAQESYRRARDAQERGASAEEIVPVEITGRRGAVTVVDADEEPGKGDPAKFGKLRPAFKKDGTITAANASTLNDGAAALLIASEAAVKKNGWKPLARIVAYGGAAQAPEWFTTAPAKAIEKTLARTDYSAKDIGLWEINEAFACVTMACSKLAGLDPERVNVRGGAVALGHPIGATGARLLTTLLYSMKEKQERLGLATLCIGGGEALAVLVERV
jgi:acetyl-CoA C-acetyltransferase